MLVPMRARTNDLSLAQARRMSLAAQGFASRRPSNPGFKHVRAVATRLQALQIDSVNVLVRAHYLPIFSRLGPYPIAALDRLTNDRHDLIEHAAHQASFVPVEIEPLLRGRRGDRSQQSQGSWRRSVDAAYADAVERQVVERGPIALSDLDDPRKREKKSPAELTFRRRDGQPYAESSLRWHRQSDGKMVLDGLLDEGRLALAGRRGVERLYDLAERVIPAAVRDQPTPSSEVVRRELVELAAVALGVATIGDLANYFQLKVGDARVAVRDLVSGGLLEEVRVEGWTVPAFVPPRAVCPASIETEALLGPFDSLTWSRDRTKRLFGFDFSFEIYVPEAKRRYGYYVLPFLLGDRLVARVDLKVDRRRCALVASGAYAEPGVKPESVAPALRRELEQMASWLGMEHIQTGGRGDLVTAIA
jgi:uncharacterized protein YcaQ